MEDGGQLVSAKVLAGLFNLTERRVQQLAKDGTIHKADRGKYPMVAAIKGYITFLQQKAFGSEAAPTANIHDERARLARANADKTEHELAILQGKLVPIEVVQVVWEDQIAAFRAKLLSIPVKMAAELHGVESKKEIQAKAQRLMWDALAELSEYESDRDRVAAAIERKQSGSAPAAVKG